MVMICPDRLGTTIALLCGEKTEHGAAFLLHVCAGNIHPEYKAPVGERLAWAARALAYGEVRKTPMFWF
jgi:hypothetical protein